MRNTQHENNARDPFETLWQKKVFDLLLKENKIDPSVVTQMLGWNHSGFGVHHAVRLGADDHAHRRWAALIKRVWQVDPLRCPQCFPIAVTTRAYFDNLGVTLCEADLDGNGTVDIVDFLQLLFEWGPCE